MVAFPEIVRFKAVVSMETLAVALLFEYVVSKDYINKRVLYLLRCVCPVFIIVVLFVRFTGTRPVHAAFNAVCGCLYAFMFLNVSAELVRIRQDALIKFLGVFILCICYMLDFSRSGIYWDITYGIVGVSMFFIFMEFSRKREFDENRDKLESLGKLLEYEICKRTFELSALNKNLNEEIEARKTAEHDLIKQSTTDSLTGISNRMYGQNLLTAMLDLYDRYKNIFSIILVDIDFFKGINDTYGHNEGDAVLINVAGIFDDTLRKSDIKCRWGGEEFLLIIPNCTLKSAIYLAEKIRKAVASQSIERVGPVTISLGVTQVLEGDDTKSLIKRSDENLYMAKRTGRNRTCSDKNR